MGGALFPFTENIFTQQPSYFGDLDETLPTVLQVLLFCSELGFHLEMWHSSEGGGEGETENKCGCRRAGCICFSLYSLSYAQVCQVVFEPLSKTIS